MLSKQSKNNILSKQSKNNILSKQSKNNIKQIKLNKVKLLKLCFYTVNDLTFLRKFFLVLCHDISLKITSM